MSEEISDIDDDTEFDELSEYDRRLARCRPANKTAIFDALAAAGISAVEAAFSERPRRGRVEKIEASIGRTAAALPKTSIGYIRPAGKSGATRRRTMTLRKAIEAFIHDAVEYLQAHHPVEAGSYVHFIFNVRGVRTSPTGIRVFGARTVLLDVQRRVVETEYSFHEF